jgi:hypothetical protein
MGASVLTVVFVVLGLFIFVLAMFVLVKLRHVPNTGYRLFALFLMELSCVSAIFAFQGYRQFELPSFLCLALGLLLLFAVALPNLRRR